MDSKLIKDKYFNVTCVSKVYDENRRPLDHLYKIGEQYRCIYCYDKQLSNDNDVIEFEWMVYCAKHNHYQFTNIDFKRYFIDTIENRDRKIESILNT